MQKFTHIIENEFAMHFGPAGRLAEIAQTYPDCTLLGSLERPALCICLIYR